MDSKNVALVTLMAKVDEKSARDSAKRMGKLYDECMDKLGDINISEEVAKQFGNALDTIKNGFKNINVSSYTDKLLDSLFKDSTIKEKQNEILNFIKSTTVMRETYGELSKTLDVVNSKFKNVNLSSYGNELLKSFSTKDLDETRKDVNEFVESIDLLQKASKGLDKNAFSGFTLQQLNSVITQQRKIEEQQKKIDNKKLDYSVKANEIAKKGINKYNGIGNKENETELYNKLIQDSKIDEKDSSLTIKAKNLAHYTNEIKEAMKITPKDGTKEAIEHWSSLLDIVKKAKDTATNFDKATSGDKGNSFLKDMVPEINTLTTGGLLKAKDAFVNASVSGLLGTKKTLESKLSSYISDTVKSNTDKMNATASETIGKTAEKAEKLNEEANKLKETQKEMKESSKDGIVASDKDVKSLDEITARLKKLNDEYLKGDDDNFSNKKIKEFISLFKEYESLISNTNGNGIDSNLKESYDSFMLDPSFKKYADKLDEIAKKKKEINNIEIAEQSGGSAMGGYTKQGGNLVTTEEYAKQEQQMKETASAGEKLQEVEKELSTGTVITVDAEQAIADINKVKENLESIPNEKNIKINVSNNDYSTTPLLSNESANTVSESVVKQQEKIQESLKETDNQVQRIAYHYGLLNEGQGGKKSHQFGDEIKSYAQGLSNGGRGWADGTGTYVTDNASEFNKITESEPLKRFFALDTSKLKMYEAHVEEEAEKFYKFQHKLEQFVITLGSGYTGFDDNIGNTTSESLYAEAKNVFSKYSNVFNSVFKNFEDFDAFIDKMVNLVSESGISKNGLEAKNAKKLMEFRKKNGTDDIKTRFLKQLGFQGTDLSGTSYGGLQSGSVIFDLNTAPIIAEGKTIEEVLDKIGIKAEDAKFKLEEVANTAKVVNEISSAKASNNTTQDNKINNSNNIPSGNNSVKVQNELQQEEKQVQKNIDSIKELLDLKTQIDNVNKSFYSGKHSNDWVGIYKSQEDAISSDLSDKKGKLHSSLNLILSEDKNVLNELEGKINKLKTSLQSIQDMSNRISSNSSITYLDKDNGSEDSYKGYAEAYKAIDDRLKELNNQYKLTNDELEEYITLQVKAEKVMDRMIANFGGVKASGAKNKAELKSWIEQSFAGDLGLNPDDVYNGLFGNITDALYNGNDISLFDADGAKRSLREISAEILNYKSSISGITGELGANEDSKKLRELNTILSYIKKNANDIESTDFSSQIKQTKELVDFYSKKISDGVHTDFYSESLEETQNKLNALILLQERLNNAKNSQNNESITEQQNKLQDELKETQKQAEQTKQSIKEVSPSSIVTPIKYESQNSQSMKTSKGDIDEVTKAIDKKTESIIEEQSQVVKSVDNEVKKFKELKESVEVVKKAIDENIEAINKQIDTQKELTSSTPSKSENDTVVSTTSIENEAKAMDMVTESATNASIAKGKFVDANKDVQVSVDTSEEKLKSEAELMDSVAKSAENAAKAKERYKSVGGSIDNVNGQKEVNYYTKEALQKKESRESARKEQQEKVKRAAYDQILAWSKIQELRVAENDVNSTKPKNQIAEERKEYQKLYIEADRILKANSELYNKESQLVKLENIRKNASERISFNFNNELDQMDYKLKASKTLYNKYNNARPDDEKSSFYKANLSAINSVINRMNELNNISKNAGTIDPKIKDEYDRLAKSVNEYAESLKSIKSAQKGSTEIARAKELDKISKYLKENTKLSRDARAELNGYLNLLRTGDASVNVEDIHNKFLKVVDVERAAGREGKTFLDIFKNKALYGFASQLAMYYMSIYDFIRYAMNAVTTIVELDDSLIDLKKTTAMTSNQLDQFYLDANKVAKQMGVTTKEIIDQASAWSRLNKTGLLYGDI